LREAFDETSPIARTDASSEQDPRKPGERDAPPAPKVVVMPDVRVVTRGEPRRPES
jgi:hypothetical protein